MAKLKSGKMRIAGVTAALPDNQTSIFELGKLYFEKEFIETMNKVVGVEKIYVCSENQSSGDLAYAAADELIKALKWEPKSIDALLFISQTPDYVIPPTSCELQNRLGLSNNVFTMDSNYGCAGFSMGLMIASQFIETSQFKRILILNAECHRRFVSNEDKDGALLFSDGASAVAVECSDIDNEAYFMSHVDGSHSEDIVLGMFKKAQHINKYGQQYSYMNGEVVTQFMLRNIPKMVKNLLEYSNRSKEDIDSYLFHQANAHMVKYVSKRMKLDLNKVPANINSFANTSSVAIPLLLCDTKKELFNKREKETVMMLGYGAGFLMAGAVIELENLVGGHIIYV